MEATVEKREFTPDQLAILEKVKAYIREEPRRFIMDSWLIDVKGDSWYSDELIGRDGDDLPPCGTAACIAGTVVLVTAGKNYKEVKNPERFASTVLGLRSHYNGPSIPAPNPAMLFEPEEPDDDMPFEADLLFQLDSWPEDFQFRYRTTQSLTERAEIACERIDYFAANRK